jgi:Zn-finger nucleic acid-binding protein
MSARQGVEIDYCPSCRGVWLDRGELDKLIERSSDFSENDRRRTVSDDRDHYKYRKKKSLLGEIFDF